MLWQMQHTAFAEELSKSLSSNWRSLANAFKARIMLLTALVEAHHADFEQIGAGRLHDCNVVDTAKKKAGRNLRGEGSRQSSRQEVRDASFS